jgi:hypothetical protein
MSGVFVVDGQAGFVLWIKPSIPQPFHGNGDKLWRNLEADSPATHALRRDERAACTHERIEHKVSGLSVNL